MPKKGLTKANRVPADFDVAVIGGGPAGIMAALAAAANGAHVVLLEAGPRLGGNIMVSGNGRCNLSNTKIDQHESNFSAPYHNGDFARAVLASHDSTWLRELFATWGLAVTDQAGWLYPVTRYAGSVLEVLLRELARATVQIQLDYPVQELVVTADGFLLQQSEVSGANQTTAGVTVTAAGVAKLATVKAEKIKRFRASAVVLACNIWGLPVELLASLVGNLESAQPILCPLNLQDTELRALDGLRANCRFSLLRAGQPVFSENGEILFRRYGISGIVSFNASRFAEPGDEVSLDFSSFWPNMSVGQDPVITQAPHPPGPQIPPDLFNQLCQLRSRYAREFSETLFDGHLRRALGRVLLQRAGVDPEAKITKITDAQLATLAQLSTDLRFRLSSSPQQQQLAQLQRGGVSVSQLDPKSLQSRLTPGLYIAGELVDVDGPCGGYNLHWAWASGWTAGAAAAQASQAAAAAAPSSTQTNATAPPSKQPDASSPAPTQPAPQRTTPGD